jgi:hypothetical protein
MLHQFNLDGHRALRTQLPTTQPIVSLSRSGNFLAAATGNQFTLVNVQGSKHFFFASPHCEIFCSGLRRLKTYCEAPLDIVSIAIEEGAAWSISAMLLDGSIVMFNTAKKLTDEQSKTPGYCDMETVYRAPLAPSPIYATSSEKIIFARGYLWASQGCCGLHVYNTSGTTRSSAEVFPLGSMSFSEEGCDGCDLVAVAARSRCNNYINCTHFPSKVENVEFHERGSFACCQCLVEESTGTEYSGSESSPAGLRNHCIQSAQGISLAATLPFLHSNSNSQHKGIFAIFKAILPQGPPPSIPNPYLTVIFQTAGQTAGATIVAYRSSLVYTPYYNPATYYYDIGKLLVAVAVGIGMLFWRRMSKKGKAAKPRSPTRGFGPPSESDGDLNGFNMHASRFSGVPASEMFRQSSSVQKR